MQVKKKRGVEAPLRVRSFIYSVTSTPLESIEAPLSKFSWDYEKGDVYHWVDLLNHFDLFFEKYVKPGKELQLDDNFLGHDHSFPKDSVLQILRVTRIILENSMNRYLYNSHEHVSALLASSDPEILVAALETLAAYVKKPLLSNRAMRWHGDVTFNARLFSLSQGWGGKEEGLGLLGCVVDDGCDAEAVRLGSTLHFEFYESEASRGQSEGTTASKTSGLQVIHVPGLQYYPEDDLQLLKQLTEKHKVPHNLRFALLTRIRFARAFGSLSGRRQYTCIRLLAFTALVQSNPDHEDLTAFFVNEPEFVNELVTVLQWEDSVPENIRILAVQALAAQSQDRPRQSNVLSVLSAGGNRGILPGLMQKAIDSITSGQSDYSVSFVEALLSLVTVLVSSSSGCAALREAGLIPTLLPLLRDMDARHIHLVSSAVHVLEAFMDYSNPAGSLFRDLGGLDDAVARLKQEVSVLMEGAAKPESVLVSDYKGKAPTAGDGESSAAFPHSEALVPYQQRILLKALLRAIALGMYAPGSAIRMHSTDESALPSCLFTIFRHAREFGGGVFSLAASLMSDLIHKDPTCFASLDSTGLIAAYLDAITSGVVPSSDAVGCIPNSLDAICLNTSGLQAVKDRNALQCFVRIFTSKGYLRALANDTPGSLASGLDELMRHAPTLRGPFIDVCIEILKTISTMGGAGSTPSKMFQEAPGLDTPAPMDTDSSERSGPSVVPDATGIGGTSSSVNEATAGASSANLETFLPECINNVVRLLETILQNVDTSRVFIEKKGVEALLQIYTLPSLPVSFGGSSTAHNMSVTFRAFPPQHSSVLTRAVCSALRYEVKLAVEVLESLGGAKLSDLDDSIRNKVVRSLSVAECFVSLASVLVRSSTAMMPALSNGGAEVLYSVGQVHREVLWQIALIDDAKVDSRKEGESSRSTLAVSTGNRGGDDEPDMFSVIRYADHASARNGSMSHWGFESEFLPVLHDGVEESHQRTREHVGTAEAITRIARLGRLPYRNLDPVQVDSDSPTTHEIPEAQDQTGKKSPDGIDNELMVRVAVAIRGLYVALGKVLVLPSSRRRDEVVSISGPAKAIASVLAKLLGDEVSFNGHCTSLQNEPPPSVKCRYLGKVAEDIILVAFDSRKRTCNAVLINHLYAHGAIQGVLGTFGQLCQHLWRDGQASDSAMETDDSKSEIEKKEEKPESSTWLLDALNNFSRLLDHLVTSSLLMAPTSMIQLLAQPVVGGLEPVPKDPESFIRAIQAQVLEVVLPVWNHPMFPQCPASFITAIVSVITNIYTGVGERRGPRNVTGRIAGPPPDELSISRIVEMGFSRARAEEALRRTEVNSVEMATEWLCSVPEGSAQEDDELARALALSLGNAEGSDKEQDLGTTRDGANEREPQVVPVLDMMRTCINLLQGADGAAFPVADLLVTVCNRENGQDRAGVVAFLVEQLQQQSKLSESCSRSSALSTISHTLALVLSEDSNARDVAAELGVINVALEVLMTFSPGQIPVGARLDVPKWFAALLLVLFHMLQYNSKTNLDKPPRMVSNGAATNPVATSSMGHTPGSKDSHEKDGNPFTSVLGKSTGYMTDEEQTRAMSVCCNFLRVQVVPPAAAQAVLQLCARLTKTHAVALQFLEQGGLSGLLGLSVTSLFPGFETIASSIIRHLLEDPQTLQQAMESEVRLTLMALLSRHSDRVSPRVFLTAMAPVISRDSGIFMRAVGAVCQIETVGGRPAIILAKEREKEWDKDKDKEKAQDKEKGRPVSATEVPTGQAVGGSKVSEGIGKSVKPHKRVPSSFSQVIDHLLEVIMHYPPPGKGGDTQPSKDASVTAMEVDDVGLQEKGKAPVVDSSKPENDTVSESAAALAKASFILKLVTEVLLMYSSAVSVVLRRDAESSQGRGPHQGGLEAIGHGGLLYHVLHRLLPHSGDRMNGKPSFDESRENLSDQSAYFLMAICVRSGEGRRRVVVEVARALTAAAKVGDAGSSSARQPPNRKVRVFVDLVNSILLSNPSSGNPQAPGFSPEMARIMVDTGMVQALTNTLQTVDLDHPDAPKLVNLVLKAMEVLTRAGSSDQTSTMLHLNQERGVPGRRPDENVADINGLTSSGASPAGDPVEQMRDEAMHDSGQLDAHLVDSTFRPSTAAEINREEAMEHDMGLGRETATIVQLDAAEEEFMREAAEDALELEDAAAEMAFRMERGPGDVGDEEDEQQDMGDDEDDDDDGDDGDEEEEDDDEDNIEGDGGVPHMSPHDTDLDDNQEAGLADDYEDGRVEEEEDDDDDDDDDDDEDDEDDDDEWGDERVIEVRWRDGLTGLNHVQVLGHSGTADLVDFTGDFQGMNMDDVFGSFRRAGGGGDRRRATAYRTFPERPGERGAFRHPLLSRPSNPGAGSAGPIFTSNLWPTTGAFLRDTEALLGGSNLDVTHFYMYDSPFLSDHSGDGLFGERNSAGPPPPLLDFSMDPVYLMGRRGGRADSRWSSWTDDGEPQAGANAAAVAQAVEEQFISHLQIHVATEDQTVDHIGTSTAQERNETMAAEPQAVPSSDMGQSEDVHPVIANRDSERPAARQHPDPAAVRNESKNVSSAPSVPAAGQASVQHSAEQRAAIGVELDVQMHDDRNEPAVRDVEAGSQDSGGSGATVGESLRSLEVEVGSPDGCDQDERQAGPDRLNSGQMPRSAGPELVNPGTHVRNAIDEARATDENMVSAQERRQQGNEAGIPDSLRLATSRPATAVSIQIDDTGVDGREDGTDRNLQGTGVTSIDPTFLEALPEDWREEVLASQQTQTARVDSHPSLPAEDIDPEFLAALPPDIQAEVLSQQRAQRVVPPSEIEGQPVDMDSASIIATFPAELREEVLLTSSETVLSALPPALIAEARLLRERAMNQFQARGLFGSHRAAGRRNSMGLGIGIAPAAMERGVAVVGSDPSLSISQRPGVGLGSGVRKMKEVEGLPLVDTPALKAMLQLLHLAQPLGKGLLQRLLLNLCAHTGTRVILLQLLLDILRPEADDSTSCLSSPDGVPAQRLYGCQWNVVYARCQSADGVPPLVSRRVLEILTYLARNHSSVANMLLYLEPPSSSQSSASKCFPRKPLDPKHEKGKAKLLDGQATCSDSVAVKSEGEMPLILLLKLLNRPLYSRSSAHLEQVMDLLEVVTSSTAVKPDGRASARPASLTDSATRISRSSADAVVQIDADSHSAGPSEAGVGAELQSSSEAVAGKTVVSKPPPANDGTENLKTSPAESEHKDATSVFLCLPGPELRNLCDLLAREGLSDLALSRVAEVLKKLVIAAPPHRRLFVNELADTARRLCGPAIRELERIGEADTSIISTTSITGAAILRVLQALSALASSGSSIKETDSDTVEKREEEGLLVICDLNSSLEKLWMALSRSIAKVEGSLRNSFGPLAQTSNMGAASVNVAGTIPPLPLGTQRLLPFVEGFFVLCEKLLSGPPSTGPSEPLSSTAREIKEAASSSASDIDIVSTPKSPCTPQRKPDEKGMTFLRFADKHRKLLNAFIRQNPSLLEKSLALLLKTPRLIDFDNKRAYFRSRIRQQHEQQHYAPLRIGVRRPYVLEDSYNQLRMRTPDELKGRLTVQFQGEEGIDAGGLTREWYQLLSRVTFDKGALLFTTVGNESTFQPNPNSVYQTEHLSYLKFVGRVVAKALFDGQLLDVYFTRSFYKHILGVKVTYHDIEAIDPDYYKNLKWMLENDISDILGLTFSMDADEEKHILYEKTEVTDHELIVGGRNIRVTEENKHEYVDLVAEHRLTTAIRPQITAFLEGFNELVNRELISIFNDKELELLISGLPEIDLEDLKSNTEYTGYTAASPVVQWFWEVVHAFTKEDMACLLQFITGTSKIPLEGFRALQGISGPQRFQIHKAYGPPERLPSAHTCFNQLDLPEYSSKEQLLERLLLAIHEASEGFGFG